jgi:hypothetical protein
MPYRADFGAFGADSRRRRHGDSSLDAGRPVREKTESETRLSPNSPILSYGDLPWGVSNIPWFINLRFRH